MRTAHWKAHLLPLLLLLLHSVSVCLAGICAFEESLRNFDPLSIATAKEQPTGPNWEPLRIAVSGEDLQGPLKYCLKRDGTMTERGTKGADAGCIDYYFTLTADQRKIVMGILEKAIALHTDRLFVQRTVGPLVIPDFSTHPRCKLLNVPAKHHSDGVADADMVLYVASNPYSISYHSHLVGETCARSAGGRPIAGILSIGSYGNIEINRHTVRFTAHHIAHALGFSYNEMKLRNMIVDKTVRGKTNPVAVVVSKKTKEMTQEHFGCSTAEGMELEDGENNNRKTLSHWERRIAKDELMAEPTMGPVTLFMGFYTNLTLAAFEDMGFYKANFTMAEDMIYGYKTGCDFLNGKCMDKGVTEWPNMFCNVPESNDIPSGCTTDRLRLGGCTLAKGYGSNLPEHFRYLETPDKGGFDFLFTDYCPVFEADVSSFECTNLAPEAKVPGSLYSKNSMCLNGNALKVKKDSGVIPMAAVCAEISCEGGSVKVKYLGDKDADKWHDCPEGKSLTPSSTSDSFVSGTITCPKYKEVCTVAPDGSSLVAKVIHESMEPSGSKSPTASQDPKAPRDPTTSQNPKVSQDPTTSQNPKVSQDPTSSQNPKVSQDPTSSQNPKVSQDPTRSQDPKASQDPTASQDPKASDKPTGKPNDSRSGGMSNDGGSAPFALVSSMTFLVLSFAGYLVA